MDLEGKLNSARRMLKFVPLLLIGLAFYDQLRRPPEERTWNGHLLFVPYDFRPPSLDRIFERWWNPDDPRNLTPHVFGVGWSINLYQLWKTLSNS